MPACKALIVDDEEAARERLARMVSSHSQDFDLEFAKNGLECLEKISSFQPRIVFLDIQMPGMTGIEVIQQIGAEQKVKVIFQTAYDEFAIQAFEHSACDYLMKPVRQDRLDKAIQKALDEATRDDELEKLSQAYQKNNKFVQNLTVKYAGRLKSIPVSDILYFQVQDDYTAVNVEGNEFLVDHSLSHIEKILSPKSFVRCHRSYMVNVSKVDSLKSGRNMSLLLVDKTEIPVARQKRNVVKNLFVEGL